MVSLKGTFDASKYDSGFTLVEPGQYTAYIKDSTPLERANGAAGVTLHFVIVGGDFDGAVIKEDYTIFSAQKEEHVEYARNAFARVCNACNVPLAADTAQLHNIPIGIEIENRTWTDAEGRERKTNRIKRYWSMQKKPTVTQQPTPAPTSDGHPSFMNPGNSQPPF